MKHLTTLLTLFFASMLIGQNSYHIPEAINAREKWIISSDAAPLSTPSTYLMIYQHGGATLNQSGSDIGNVATYNGAGHYDLNRVERTSGDTIFLTLPVRNEYDLTTTQIILYQSSAVQEVSGNQLISQSFDDRLGGVLFLAAGDTLRLTSNADLNANGSGFRGGAGTEADSDCSRFTRAAGEVYAAGNWRGSSRGEGIGGIPTGQEFGRAGAANGGGGGNDHNTGGGGGANVAPGGRGAINVVGGILNSACRGAFPGRGGFSLLTNPNRVYLGGGGGAGHANNTDQARGKNGGGLIVLWAPHLDFGENTVLSAQGEMEIVPAAINGDGGGGGGAGGTVLLVGATMSGAPVILLNGSDGVSTVNQNDRCFGPGGGGAGGRMVVRAEDQSQFSPTVTAQGGSPGLRLNSSACTPTSEPGLTGGNSSVENYDLNIPTSRFDVAFDTLCGPGQITIGFTRFATNRVNNRVTPIDPDLSFRNLGDRILFTYTGTRGGTFTLRQDLFADGRTYPGDSVTVTFLPVAAAGSIAVDNDNEVVTISLTDTTNISLIRYNFGDGNILDTTATELTYRYPAGGTYPLTVTLLNSTCPDEIIYSEEVAIPTFSEAIINEKGTRGCVPLTLIFRDISLNASGLREWSFPGGTPATSAEVEPVVVYDTPGNYTALLRLIDGVGPDTLDSVVVEVYPLPVADFNFAVDTSTAAFTDLSSGAASWRWDFGDGNESEEQNPVHVYDSTGNYTVTLIADNGNCSDTIRQGVMIDVLSGVDDLASLGIRLYPNPTSGRLQLEGPARITEIRDLNGRTMRRGNGTSADLSGLPAGPYLILLSTRTRQYSTVIIKRE